jgi:hypothetical protein
MNCEHAPLPDRKRPRRGFHRRPERRQKNERQGSLFVELLGVAHDQPEMPNILSMSVVSWSVASVYRRSGLRRDPGCLGEGLVEFVVGAAQGKGGAGVTAGAECGGAASGVQRQDPQLRADLAGVVVDGGELLVDCGCGESARDESERRSDDQSGGGVVLGGRRWPWVLLSSPCRRSRCDVDGGFDGTIKVRLAYIMVG